MLLLIFSSYATNFAEEKNILANFDLLNSCKKMPLALAHLKHAQTVWYRSAAPWRRLLTLREWLWVRILFSETEAILKVAAAARLLNNYVSACHWEFRKRSNKLREKHVKIKVSK